MPGVMLDYTIPLTNLKSIEKGGLYYHSSNFPLQSAKAQGTACWNRRLGDLTACYVFESAGGQLAMLGRGWETVKLQATLEYIFYK